MSLFSKEKNIRVTDIQRQRMYRLDPSCAENRDVGQFKHFAEVDAAMKLYEQNFTVLKTWWESGMLGEEVLWVEYGVMEQ